MEVLSTCIIITSYTIVQIMHVADSCNTGKSALLDIYMNAQRRGHWQAIYKQQKFISGLTTN